MVLQILGTLMEGAMFNDPTVGIASSNIGIGQENGVPTLNPKIPKPPRQSSAELQAAIAGE